MSLSKGAQVALLKWVNTFDGLDRKAQSLDDLTDGIILAQVLAILNPDFDRAALKPHATSWLDKKRNLETVYRALAQFLRQENPYLAPSPNQFRGIIDNPDANGMCEVSISKTRLPCFLCVSGDMEHWLTDQFLSAFVSAACLGDLATTYVPAIMKMDRPDQREIMSIIQRKQIQIEEAKKRAELNGGLDGPLSPGDDPHSLQSRDPDLAKEAEIARLSKEIDTVKKQNADLLTRNEQLQMSRDDVVRDLQIAQREVDVLRKTNESDASAIIRKLEQEKREEEHLIDNLQAQAEDDRLDKIRLRNEVEQYKTKAERANELEDRVKELEHDRDGLTSKLKQAEWYKKSAEQAKITDQRNRELESENHELREVVQEFDKVRGENSMLQQTCQQYRKQMGTYESEKFEDQAIKTSLKEENETLKLEKQILADQLRIGEDQIRDLQERMQTGISPAVPASPGAVGFSSNLEQELETTADPSIRYRLEISRLEAENKLLKNNMGVAAENERLRNEVEFEKRKHETIQTLYSEANDKYVLAQEQIRVLLSSMKGEGLVQSIDQAMKCGPLVVLTVDYHREQAYRQLKTRLDDSQQELERQRSRAQKVEHDLADKDRELLAAKTDRTCLSILHYDDLVQDLTNNLGVTVTAVGQESIDALEVLKSSDKLISASLKTELDSIRKQLEMRDIDNDQLRQQLMNALVSKDKLREQLDNTATSVPPSSAQPQSPVSVPASEGEAAQKSKKEDAEKIEKLKTALKQKIAVCEDIPEPTTPFPGFRPSTEMCSHDRTITLPPPVRAVPDQSMLYHLNGHPLPRAPPPPEVFAPRKKIPWWKF
jgi:protein HOOK3